MQIGIVITSSLCDYDYCVSFKIGRFIIPKFYNTKTSEGQILTGFFLILKKYLSIEYKKFYYKKCCVSTRRARNLLPIKNKNMCNALSRLERDVEKI